ncbi:elongation factor P maturation arginine rhamnosyltransferase EarP [Parvibium lacunae]|uniref:Protein-arginine rhamnosyltransferase n=1 Tax=Parvibium lacunae TaxID=1888893 RepID=A0A368L4W3_9BURK|nr:elongation factor P maturation arginine rhamnosyltransferase EarP [Parvibium lacunae]RCS58619.1 elongation factor P maturation arginine rhamnosyltransferase EarP [Parvibium lacunae]
MHAAAPFSCDIFCRVIDNYGDIGVCWRLARQLVDEYQWAVRLLVDDLQSLAKLVPTVDPTLAQQRIAGLVIWQWEQAPSATPAQMVVEAFACDPPVTYLQRMAQQTPPPAWVNLEYLSAETWVEDCHGLVSRHPQLGLEKVFVFPGFSPRTGGLLREKGLLAAASAFNLSPAAADQFWTTQGLTLRAQAPRLFFFTYASPHIPALLDAWLSHGQALEILLPPTPATPQVEAWLAAHPNQTLLRVHPLPFLPQAEFDRLLWASDLLFVRGEDSLVRAQWAAKPMIWHIYPQAEQAHLPKLAAFYSHYSQGLTASALAAQTALNQAWCDTNRAVDFAPLWANWRQHLPEIQSHALSWRAELSQQPDLATVLVSQAYKKWGQ